MASHELALDCVSTNVAQIREVSCVGRVSVRLSGILLVDIECMLTTCVVNDQVLVIIIINSHLHLHNWGLSISSIIHQIVVSESIKLFLVHRHEAWWATVVELIGLAPMASTVVVATTIIHNRGHCLPLISCAICWFPGRLQGFFVADPLIQTAVLVASVVKSIADHALAKQ